MARRAVILAAVAALFLGLTSNAWAQVPIVGTPRVDSHGSGQNTSMGPDGTPNIGSQADAACSSVVSSCTMVSLMKAMFGALLGPMPAGNNHIGNVNLTDAMDGTAYNATAAGTVVTEDTSGYAGVELQITTNGGNVGNVVTVTGASDANNGTFANLSCYNLTDPTQPPSATITALGHYWCTGARWVQVAVTTYVSGTVTVVPYLRGYAPETGTRWVSLMPPPGAAPGVAGALSFATIEATASTNASVITNKPARLYHLEVCNTTATMAVLKLYDRATAPTVGSSVIRAFFVVPANSCAPVLSSTLGLGFQFGIAMATTANAAAADTTAVGADSVVGTIAWSN